MIKIGDVFYLSSVEKIISPQKFKTPQNGYDRSTGKGTGHLFKFDNQGKLISKITLGDSIIFHPGGIDFDGKYIWAPVAEYRPDSRSLIYRIDPVSLTSEKIFVFSDHIGAVACDTINQKLIGVSWGSRYYYSWEMEFSGTFRNLTKDHPIRNPKYSRKENGSFYIDYQDCHIVGDHFMLCGGLKIYTIAELGRIAFGGLELIDLNTFTPVHQIPIMLYPRPGLVMTNNPFYFEKNSDWLRFYFIPEDNESEMYIYDVLND